MVEPIPSTTHTYYRTHQNIITFTCAVFLVVHQSEAVFATAVEAPVEIRASVGTTAIVRSCTLIHIYNISPQRGHRLLWFCDG